MTYRVALFILAAIVGAVQPACRWWPRPPPAGFAVSGTALMDPSGRAAFLIGASYQGPADRAWKMWADDQFDLTLIGQDFARARTCRAGRAADLRAEAAGRRTSPLAAGRSWTGCSILPTSTAWPSS